MNPLLSNQDQAAWLYNSSGSHLSFWMSDLLSLLQPYNHPRTMDQLPPLTQASTYNIFNFRSSVDRPLQGISPSPSESSLMSEDGSPSPQHLNVVCNVPIVVPKPRPYRSLANLQFQFDLPSEDEDLSHPPYCTPRSVAKRKRSDEDDDADDGFHSTADRSSKKRRAFSGPSHPLSASTVHPNMLSGSSYGFQPATRYGHSAISNKLRHRQPQDRPRVT
jgi:hypothetical protein